MLLTMLGAVAEFELAMIRERQAEGIAVAKAAGKYKGPQGHPRRPAGHRTSCSPHRGESVAALAREYGITRQSVYNYLGRSA